MQQVGDGIELSGVGEDYTLASTNRTPAMSRPDRKSTTRPESQPPALAAQREELISAKSFIRKTGEPIWSQITRSVEEQIIVGNLPSGTRLPTETHLAASYGVNRHTLRRALRELVRKGLITATPRRGTIVSRRRIPYPISSNISFEDVISSTGRESSERLLSHSIGLAPKTMTDWLGIAERSKVIDLQFLRVANDVPVCVTSSWMPADRFERIGDIFERLGSLERALAKCGVSKHSLHQTRITCQPANEDETKQLDIPPGASVLVVNSLFVDDGDEPILATHNRFAADRVELIVGS
jgi:GntR family phosphonate transport system transcriptional regulator